VSGVKVGRVVSEGQHGMPNEGLQTCTRQHPYGSLSGLLDCDNCSVLAAHCMLQRRAWTDQILIVTRRRLIGSAVSIYPQIVPLADILAPNIHHFFRAQGVLASDWLEYGGEETRTNYLTAHLPERRWGNATGGQPRSSTTAFSSSSAASVVGLWDSNLGTTSAAANVVAKPYDECLLGACGRVQTRGLCHLPYGPGIAWHCLGWTMTHGLCSYRERRPGLISPGEFWSISGRQLWEEEARPRKGRRLTR
jgi:hypothetical protein